jgi:hypothetical protein
MQASASVELPAADQAAAAPLEVRMVTDAAEASCQDLEEPRLANLEQAETEPMSDVASAKSRGGEGTPSHIVHVLLLKSSLAYLHDDSHIHSLVYS